MIYWTDFSKNELRTIFNYYRERFDLETARTVLSGILQAILKLENQPYVGPRDELLRDREKRFRFLVYKKHKVIYWVNIKENRIEIIDVFNIHQNPEKIVRVKK